MKAKERVARVIRREPTDRVPWGEICIDEALVNDLLGCSIVGFEERREFVERLGLDIVCLSPALPLFSADRLPLAAEVIWPELDQWVQRTDRFPFVVIDGAFGWGARLWGYGQLFRVLANGSRELLHLTQAVEKLNLEIVRRAVAMGAAGVMIADDIAYQRGLLVNPIMLRSFYFPFLARQAEGIKTLGVPLFFHSDGNLNEVLGDLVRAGFDGLHCLEKAAGMDIIRIKERYGKVLCLWGNLDPGEVIFPRNQKELREQVRSLLSAASPSGGFIFGTSSGLVNGMRVENLEVIAGCLGEEIELLEEGILPA